MKTASISFLLILAAAWTGPSLARVEGMAEYVLEVRPADGADVTPEMREEAIRGVSQVLAPLRFNRVQVEPAPLAAQIRLRVLFAPDVFAAEPEVRKAISQALLTHTLAFALVDEGKAPATIEEFRAGRRVPGFALKEAYRGVDEQAVIVDLSTQLEGQIVKNAWASYELQGYQINIALKLEAAAKMRALSEPNIGRRLAILVDDKAISAPTIQSELGEQFVITGQFTKEEAEKLATFLKNPLANPVVIVNTSHPGSTLSAP